MLTRDTLNTFQSNRPIILFNDYIYPGARVCHVKETSIGGIIIDVDHNLAGITTCTVLWDDCADGELDIQWTNKLAPFEFRHNEWAYTGFRHKNWRH